MVRHGPIQAGHMIIPEHLLDGYRAFTSQRLPTEQTRYRELSERGQSPAVMVIGCRDSRVSPEVIFDAGPGELFVVRNVANLVPVFSPTTMPTASRRRWNMRSGSAHQAYRGAGPCTVRRHPRLIDKIDPLSPGDFIGSLDGDVHQAGRDRRAARARDDAGFHCQNRKGRGVPQARKPDDVPVRAHPRRERRDAIARRLFRRCRGLAVRARPGGQGISGRRGKSKNCGGRRAGNSEDVPRVSAI